MKAYMAQNEYQCLSTETRRLQALLRQTQILAFSCLGFTLVDLIMMITGNHLFSKGSDFQCLNGNQIEASSEGGAIFFLVYMLLLYGFSLMMWLVFYKVPDRYGLVISRSAALVVM